MRSLAVVGGVIAALSLLALFGFVLPELEDYKSQLLLLGPLSMLAGEDAQSELQGRLNALYFLRNTTIGGAVIGLMLAIFRLNSKNKTVETKATSSTRSSEYYIYVGFATAILVAGMLFYALSAGSAG